MITHPEDPKRTPTKGELEMGYWFTPKQLKDERKLNKILADEQYRDNLQAKIRGIDERMQAAMAAPIERIKPLSDIKDEITKTRRKILDCKTRITKANTTQKQIEIQALINMHEGFIHGLKWAIGNTEP